MTPYYQDSAVRVYHADVTQGIPLEDGSVQCVVTSPPYWNLRDYSVDAQLGLESTPELYVARMVAVFREVRRVLRDDGTLWCNMGDGFQDKQLVGMPWRVAFALQTDGWFLRSEIIWSKPAPMPESVRDRPTKSHEQIFLLTKRPTYYYDADAVRAPAAPSVIARAAYAVGGTKLAANGDRHDGDKGQRTSFAEYQAGRNLRSVWTISTQAFPGLHFATFPEALVVPCIKAGTSERGACPACGAPWARVVDRTSSEPARAFIGKALTSPRQDGVSGRADGRAGGFYDAQCMTTGWRPGCACGRPDTVPCVVLDPFSGSGTALYVAKELGRHAVGVELNAAYIDLGARRCAQDVLPFFA